MAKTETTEPKLNMAREMMQSFLDEMIPIADKAEATRRLWAIHDEGYASTLRNNGLGV